MPANLPADALLAADTVTFLFTDIEGSTRLWEEDPERMRPALARHDLLTRSAVEGHRGTVVKMIGDGVHAAFADPIDAVRAAVQLQQALADPEATRGMPLRVRCGLHLGVVEQRDNDFFGSAVNRAARLMAAAHGGQAIVSQAVVDRIVDRLPQAVSLRNLGAVRLRDLARPERVYQIVHPQLRQEFPALRSLEATPNNLASQVTSFVGREREVAEVKQLLGKTRLVTLLGAGGLGKTRLSLHVAAEVLDDYTDGVWLVELAPLADARLLAQAAAAVLGVKEEAGRPVQEALLTFVADRRLLLLLDNCEHLLQGCAELAKELLQAGPQVKLLATSREPLHVAGEASCPVLPLSVPEPRLRLAHTALTQYEAVRLFVERAQAVQPVFAVTAENAASVADICRQLDGIPLALELAAARVRALSIETIAARLADHFRLLTRGERTALPRHQTLRACIDWSYDLLRGPERALLRRLAVFAGGWTLEAAEAVGADQELAATEIIDLLTQLVEKSLVAMAADGGRYRLLETIRQYAQDRLHEAGGGDAARDRHRDYFMALSEKAELKLKGSEQVAWIRRLDEENENLRAGLDWSLVAPGSEAGLRLCGALQRFWTTRGHLSEGREWCARILGKAGSEERTEERGKVLSAAGILAYRQSDYATARALHEEALAIRRQLRDRGAVATSLTQLGNVAFGRGDYASARILHEESLAIMREFGDRWSIAVSLNNLGNVVCEQGDYVSARAFHEEALAIRRLLGDPNAVATALNNLGVVALCQGDVAAARMRGEESLAIWRDLGDRGGVGNALHNVGLVAFAQGDYPATGSLLRESLAIRRDIGDRWGVAHTLEELAALGAAVGDSLRAARIWSAAERLREEIGSPLSPSDRPQYERRVAAARAKLGDDAAFDRAWREGHALTLEQAIELALVDTAPRP